MKVELLHYTPLEVTDKAISKCWDTACRTGDDMKARIYKVGNKNKHSSTLEHINYSFDIDGISRACLQELARHRHQSLSVKSTRYTLRELIKEPEISAIFNYNLNGAWGIAKKYLVSTGDIDIDNSSIAALQNLQRLLKEGKSNDIVKYCMPEAYKTSLVSTMNMRALQNFLYLRTDKAALWEIQELAHKMFEVLPSEHKFMLEDFVKDGKN